MGLITAESFNKYFAVFILTAINLLNYMDRFTIAGILNLLENVDRSGFKIHHLKEHVDDTYGGLLQTAFIVSYMLFSPLFGYLGDRYRRKYIITIGILIWSAFTLAGSFAVNYWMLLGSRLLVGIGEASYATLAPTLIADLFPSDKRLRMLAIFYLAMPVGSALGYIVGSGVSSLVHSFFGKSDSWRWALRVTPGLGVLAALLVLLLLKEPVRGLNDGQRASKTGVRGKNGLHAYFEDVLYLLRNRTFLLSTVGFTSMAFTTGAMAQWAPTFIQRASEMLNPGHGYGDSIAAMLFGGVTVVAGIAGTIGGSELSKLLGRWTRKSEALVCSISLFFSIPFLFLALTVVQYKVITVSWIMVFFGVTIICFHWTPVAAILLYTVIPSRRATASAIQILISHMFGDAISPTIVGGISDSISKYYGGGKAISMEFALFTSVVVLVIGGSANLLATLTVEEDRMAVENYTKKVNAHIQHNEGVGSTGPSSDSSDEPDERRQLLKGAIDEPDIVKVKTR